MKDFPARPCLILFLAFGMLVIGCQPTVSPTSLPDLAYHFIWVGDDSLATGPLDLQTQLLLEAGNYPNQLQMKTVLDPRNLLSFQPAEDSLSDLSVEKQHQFVILQMFGITKPESDQEYFGSANAWIVQIESKQGVPLLLYPWYSMVDNSQTRTQIDALVHQFAWKSKAVLIPVGPAWEKVREEHPQLQLYASDGMHPSAEGVYLSACVIYASLTGESPVGLPIYTSVSYDSPQDIVTLNRDSVLLLQQVAWDVIQDYQQKGEFQVILPK